MTDLEKKLSGHFGTLLNMGAGLLMLVIVVLIMKQLASFLQPLFIAVFFFYISDPIVKVLINRKIPSFIAHLVPLFLVVIVFVVVGWVIGAHVDNLAAQFPTYKSRLQGTFQSGIIWIFNNVPVVGEKLREVFSGQVLPIGPIETIVKATVGNFFSFISFALLVVFFLIFLMQEAGSLPQRMRSAYGPARSARILEIGKRINTNIIRYVYVKSLASLLVAMLSTAAMLGFRLDLAIFWGAMTFFANFIPYIGSACAVVFPIAIALLQFGSLGPVVALALILIFCQLLVGNFIEPKYAGQHLNLSPLIVLLSLTFWAWMWGVVGLILAIPVMVSLRIILENIPSTRTVAILMSHGAKKIEEP